MSGVSTKDESYKIKQAVGPRRKKQDNITATIILVAKCLLGARTLTNLALTFLSLVCI